MNSFCPTVVYEYENLLRGRLQKRLNRFVAVVLVEVDRDQWFEENCYMANPGSMLGMCIENAEVRLSRPNNPDRKLQYSVEAIEIEGTWIGCNTHLANVIIRNVLRDTLLCKNVGLSEFCSFKPEVKYRDSRFDFVLTGVENERKTFIEIKTVTMSSNWYDVENRHPRADKPIKNFPAERPPECSSDNTALFPDCQSVRALKHVEGLRYIVNDGSADSLLIFAIMRGDINAVMASSFCDNDYAIGLGSAARDGLQVLGLKMQLDLTDIKHGTISLVGVVPFIPTDPETPIIAANSKRKRKNCS